MTKVALIGDTHFGCRNDSTQFDDMFRRFFTDVFFPRLQADNITTVLHMGDVFDRRKYINFNTLKSCREYFFDPMQQRGINMYTVLGNHDVYFKNTNTVNSLELLLQSYENVTIFNRVSTVRLHDRNITFVPWITDDNMESVAEDLETLAAPDICIGHFEFNGFEMYKGMFCESGMAHDIVSRFSAVFTGHFHHKSARDNIYYLGAPYEMIWSDYDDFRGFHILDLETGDLEAIENPFRMFHKVYYKESKPRPKASTFRGACVKVIVEERKDQELFDAFIESLYAHDVAELTVFEDFSEYDVTHRKDDTDKVEDTLTLLLQFVDTATDEDDIKDRLKSIIKTLYIEAQHLEDGDHD